MYLDPAPVHDQRQASARRRRDARVDDDRVSIVVVFPRPVGAERDAGVAAERRQVSAVGRPGRCSMRTGRECLGWVVTAAGTRRSQSQGGGEQAQTVKNCHATPTPECSQRLHHDSHAAVRGMVLPTSGRSR